MFVRFAMERFQSVYENEVDFNLSDSGNHPMSINDLLDKDEIEKFLSNGNLLWLHPRRSSFAQIN